MNIMCLLCSLKEYGAEMMKICEWLKYWGQLLLLPIYGISFLVPRDKNLWLFCSTFGRRFADNPRYMYMYVSKNKEKLNIRPVWISHDKGIAGFISRNGYEAYYYHSLKGIWLALRAKVYIFDNYSKDINFWQSGGAVKVNLWHGIPLKKIQADNIHDRFRHPKNLWEKWKNLPRNLSDEKPMDYVLAASENLRGIFSSAFRTENVIINGYPRTDYFFSDDKEFLLMPKEQEELDAVKRFLSRHGAESVDDNGLQNDEKYTAGDSIQGSIDLYESCKNGSKAKIVYYMPTFRDSEVKFFEVMDLEKFQQFLKKDNILFCVKLHPKSKLRKEFAHVIGSGFENILLVDAVSDPYVILKMADVLVTDYSSVYFDFLLLDRPVIFFDYDMEEYITKSREMYFDYEEMTPGEKTEMMEGLIGAIGNALRPTLEYEKKYKTQRKIVRDKMFDTQGELSSPKLAEVIKDLFEVKSRR